MRGINECKYFSVMWPLRRRETAAKLVHVTLSAFHQYHLTREFVASALMHHLRALLAYVANFLVKNPASWRTDTCCWTLRSNGADLKPA